MPAGYNATLTKATVDSMCGTTAQALNIAFRNVESTKAFLDVHVDADFEAIGFAASDVATLKSALADLDQLRLIYEGVEALAAAKDFRTFAQRIWGTGWTGQ